jgi:hypothetical protein
MPDIPQQPVARRIEYRVDRDRQLHHAQRGAEVSAGNRNRIHRFRPQFVGELSQLLHGEIAHVGRVTNAVE